MSALNERAAKKLEMDDTATTSLRIDCTFVFEGIEATRTTSRRVAGDVDQAIDSKRVSLYRQACEMGPTVRLAPLLANKSVAKRK